MQNLGHRLGAVPRNEVLIVNLSVCGRRRAIAEVNVAKPVAHRQRIFAAFDRGERSPGDNEKPGVGLGLALARSLARDLGGDLTLADAASGTRFVLRLPTTA